MIFLDNASTTKPRQECLDVALLYQTERYYNPSAPYHPSVQVSTDLNECRERILRSLHGVGKIIFTSSGTESDNTALFCTTKPNGSRIIVSAAEHPAVARCADELKNKGYDVVFAPVDETGKVIVEGYKALLTPNTSLVSVMHVNNETGAINDIKTLCALAKSACKNVLFHADGVQAVGKISVHLSDLNVDLYSFSGHKIHSLRGAGGLFIKNNVHLRPILYGGGQEYNVRSSTENVSCIAAMAKAIEMSSLEMSKNFEHVKQVNTFLRQELSKRWDDYLILSPEDGSPFILNFSMRFVRGEVMLHSLEKYDIFIGTGSACSSKKQERSIAKIAHLPNEYEKGVIRVSFDENTSIEDIDYFINKLNLEYDALAKYMRG